MIPDVTREPGPHDGLEVFVSYAHADKARVQRLIGALEAAGITVWWDGMIGAGEAFARTIEARLDAVDAVLVVWTAASVGSDWVRDEASHGRDRRRFVAATLDGSLPPIGFRQYHAIDLSNWTGDASAPAFVAVLQGIARAASGVTEAAPMVAATVPASPRTWLTRRWMIGAGLALGVGTAVGVWRPWSSAGAANSIAVLPFRNLGDDKGQGWFSDGLTEEIRTRLTGEARLAVAAPTSSNRFRTDNEDARTVAEKLGVAWLLDGTVRRAEDAVRVSVSLVDGRSGLASWSQSFERAMHDVFAVERDVAAAVAVAVAGKAAGQAQTSDEVGGTRNVDAYDLYLQAKALCDLDKDEQTYRQAEQLLERAIALDPGYARAYVLQADTLILLRSAYAASPTEAATMYDRAMEAVHKALAIAPGLAQAHLHLGFAQLIDSLDYRAAMPEYTRARALAPNDPDVVLAESNLIYQTGRDAEGVAGMAFVESRDPLNPFVYRIQAAMDLAARRFDAAPAKCAHALSLNPTLLLAHAFTADSLLARGRYAEARAEYAKEPEEAFRLAGVAIAEHHLGHGDASKAAHDELVRKYGEAAMYQQAQILAQTAPADVAMAATVRAHDVKDAAILSILGDFKLDPLRNRPEFAQLLARMGLGRV